MITCRRAAELISGEQDADLPLHQRAVLGFHTLLCGPCRRYRRQLGVVEEAVEAFVAGGGTGDPGAALSPVMKEHLKALISSHLDAES
ncbi:MAG: hypothetical protein ACRC33_28330 [Gemmataceae bacterium]